MSDTAIVSSRMNAAVLEKVAVQGDLSPLSPAERVDYYRRVCDSLGLNPFTKPFDYITLNGKLTLYAKRDAADQLRKINRVSVVIASRESISDVYVVTARASTPDGRQDESTGAVSIKGLTGEALANAFMKAETKAKRRVTLSIVGLGWLDETETQSIPGARLVNVDMETGEIIQTTQPTVTVYAQPEPQPGKPETAEELAAALYGGNGHKPEDTKAEQPEIVYTSPVAVFGKARLPSSWVKALTMNAEYKADEHHIGNVVKLLRLPQETDAASVLAKVAEYLASK